MMMKKLNINERILYIIDNQYNGNQKKFSEHIGFSAQVVFNIVSGRKNKPSYDVLKAIISTNDYINCKWLITGVGEYKKNITSNDKDDYIIKLQKDRIEFLENELERLKKEKSLDHTIMYVAEPREELKKEPKQHK